MKKINRLLGILLIIVMAVSCGSGADTAKTKKKKTKEKATYQKGNLYGSLGRQVLVDDILDSIISFDPTGVTDIIMNAPFLSKDMLVFKESEGVGNGFYTGVKEEGGPEYTWSAELVTVQTLKELVQNVGWTKPVYISYENKTIPLTAYQDEDGTVKSGVGVDVKNCDYVAIDTIKDADIWYCAGLANDIRNQYARLAAYSVVIGECSKAQAEVNGFLMRDIAMLTGAKQGLSETDTDIELTDEDMAVIKSKIDELDDTIKEKIKINKNMTNAISAASAGAVKEGIDLGLIIANDVAEVALHVLEPDWIANYAISAYGSTKEMKEMGKLSDKQSKANFEYGKQLINQSKEKLKKQKDQFNAMIGD